MFWYIMIKLVEDFGGWDYKNPKHAAKNQDTFIVYYELQNKNEGYLIATLTYFAFTSLSTVGFGDYAPRSDLERAVGAFMLLCGVAIFSIIMGQFIAILNSFNQFNEENNDGDNLTKFFGVLKHFNKDFPIEAELKYRIEAFFNYRWFNDRNLAFQSESDYLMLQQLPIEVQERIFRDFLYSGFLFAFRRYFLFNRTEIEGKRNRMGVMIKNTRYT